MIRSETQNFFACFQIPRLWLECTASAVVQGDSMAILTSFAASEETLRWGWCPQRFTFQVAYTFLKVISDLFSERNEWPRGSGKLLLLSSNFGRLVLGCMDGSMMNERRSVFKKKEDNLGVCAKQKVRLTYFGKYYVVFTVLYPI